MTLRLTRDSWQQVASMPQCRRGHAATAMGGKIYVSGGDTGDGRRTRTVIVFDPSANTWTELASLSQFRAFHTSAVIVGKLYVFGGETRGSRIASVDAYDPISNTWAQVSGLTSIRTVLVAVAL